MSGPLDPRGCDLDGLAAGDGDARALGKLPQAPLVSATVAPEPSIGTASGLLAQVTPMGTASSKPASEGVAMPPVRARSRGLLQKDLPLPAPPPRFLLGHVDASGRPMESIHLEKKRSLQERAHAEGKHAARMATFEAQRTDLERLAQQLRLTDGGDEKLHAAAAKESKKALIKVNNEIRVEKLAWANHVLEQHNQHQMLLVDSGCDYESDFVLPTHSTTSVGDTLTEVKAGSSRRKRLYGCVGAVLIAAVGLGVGIGLGSTPCDDDVLLTYPDCFPAHVHDWVGCLGLNSSQATYVGRVISRGGWSSLSPCFQADETTVLAAVRAEAGVAEASVDAVAAGFALLGAGIQQASSSACVSVDMDGWLDCLGLGPAQEPLVKGVMDSNGWTDVAQLVQEDVVTALQAESAVTDASVATVSSALENGDGLPEGVTANAVITYTLTGTTLAGLTPEQEAILKEDITAYIIANTDLTPDDVLYVNLRDAKVAGRRRRRGTPERGVAGDLVLRSDKDAQSDTDLLAERMSNGTIPDLEVALDPTTVLRGAAAPPLIPLTAEDFPDSCFDGPFGLTEIEQNCLAGNGFTCDLPAMIETLAGDNGVFNITPVTDALGSALRGAGIDAGLAPISAVKMKSEACSKLPLNPNNVGLYAVLAKDEGIDSTSWQDTACFEQAAGSNGDDPRWDGDPVGSVPPSLTLPKSCLTASNNVTLDRTFRVIGTAVKLQVSGNVLFELNDPEPTVLGQPASDLSGVALYAEVSDKNRLVVQMDLAADLDMTVTLSGDGRALYRTVPTSGADNRAMIAQKVLRAGNFNIFNPLPIGGYLDVPYAVSATLYGAAVLGGPFEAAVVARITAQIGLTVVFDTANSSPFGVTVNVSPLDTFAFELVDASIALPTSVVMKFWVAPTLRVGKLEVEPASLYVEVAVTCPNLPDNRTACSATISEPELKSPFMKHGEQKTPMAWEASVNTRDLETHDSAAIAALASYFGLYAHFSAVARLEIGASEAEVDYKNERFKIALAFVADAAVELDTAAAFPEIAPDSTNAKTLCVPLPAGKTIGEVRLPPPFVGPLHYTSQLMLSATLSGSEDFGTTAFAVKFNASARIAPTLNLEFNANPENVDPEFVVDLRDTGFKITTPPTFEWDEDFRAPQGSSVTLDLRLMMGFLLYGPTVTAENMTTIADCGNVSGLPLGGLAALTGSVDISVECTVDDPGVSKTCLPLSCAGHDPAVAGSCPTGCIVDLASEAAPGGQTCLPPTAECGFVEGVELSESACTAGCVFTSGTAASLRCGIVEPPRPNRSRRSALDFLDGLNLPSSSGGGTYYSAAFNYAMVQPPGELSAAHFISVDALNKGLELALQGLGLDTSCLSVLPNGPISLTPPSISLPRACFQGDFSVEFTKTVPVLDVAQLTLEARATAGVNRAPACPDWTAISCSAWAPITCDAWQETAESLDDAAACTAITYCSFVAGTSSFAACNATDSVDGCADADGCTWDTSGPVASCVQTTPSACVPSASANEDACAALAGCEHKAASLDGDACTAWAPASCEYSTDGECSTNVDCKWDLTGERCGPRLSDADGCASAGDCVWKADASADASRCVPWPEGCEPTPGLDEANCAAAGSNCAFEVSGGFFSSEVKPGCTVQDDLFFHAQLDPPQLLVEANIYLGMSATLTIDASTEVKGQKPRNAGRIPLTHANGVCKTPLSDPLACMPGVIKTGSFALSSPLGGAPIRVPYEVSGQLFVKFKYSGQLDGFVQATAAVEFEAVVGLDTTRSGNPFYFDLITNPLHAFSFTIDKYAIAAQGNLTISLISEVELKVGPLPNKFSIISDVMIQCRAYANSTEAGGAISVIHNSAFNSGFYEDLVSDIGCEYMVSPPVVGGPLTANVGPDDPEPSTGRMQGVMNILHEAGLRSPRRAEEAAAIIGGATDMDIGLDVGMSDVFTDVSFGGGGSGGRRQRRDVGLPSLDIETGFNVDMNFTAGINTTLPAFPLGLVRTLCLPVTFGILEGSIPVPWPFLGPLRYKIFPALRFGIGADAEIAGWSASIEYDITLRCKVNLKLKGGEMVVDIGDPELIGAEKPQITLGSRPEVVASARATIQAAIHVVLQGHDGDIAEPAECGAEPVLQEGAIIGASAWINTSVQCMYSSRRSFCGVSEPTLTPPELLYPPALLDPFDYFDFEGLWNKAVDAIMDIPAFQMIGGLVSSLPELCFVWDRCTQGFTVGIGTEGGSPLTFILAPTPIRVALTAGALSTSGELVHPATEFWNPFGMARRSRRAAATSGAGGAKRGARGLEASVSHIGTRTTRSDACSDPSQCFTFFDPDGAYGFLEVMVFPITGVDSLYFVGQLTAGEYSFTFNAEFKFERVFPMIEFDLTIGSVDVAAAWGPELPSRPPGCFVKARLSLDRILDGITISAPLSDIVDLAEVAGAADVEIGMDLAVTGSGLAARMNFDLSLLGLKLNALIVMCVAPDATDDACRPLFDHYAVAAIESEVSARIAFFMQFTISGSFNLGEDGDISLFELPSMEGSVAVMHDSSFLVYASALISSPFASMDDVSATFIFSPTLFEITVESVPFFLFQFDGKFTINYGESVDTSFDISAEFSTAHLTAWLDGIAEIVAGKLDELAAEVTSASNAVDDVCSYNNGGTSAGQNCNEGDEDCSMYAVGQCSSTVAGCGSNQYCCFPDCCFSCSDCTAFAARGVELAACHTRRTAELAVCEAANLVELGLCEGRNLAVKTLCITEDGACFVLKEPLMLVLDGIAAAFEAVAEAIRAVTLFEVRALGFSAHIDTGSLAKTEFSFLIDADIVGVTMEESITINLSDLTAAISNIATRAWDAVTGDRRRRLERSADRIRARRSRRADDDHVSDTNGPGANGFNQTAALRGPALFDAAFRQHHSRTAEDWDRVDAWAEYSEWTADRAAWMENWESRVEALPSKKQDWVFRTIATALDRARLRDGEAKLPELDLHYPTNW